MSENGHPPVMSQTDVLKLAISNNIESHRMTFDSMRGIAQVQIIVNYDTRRGRPGKITIKPELVTVGLDQ